MAYIGTKPANQVIDSTLIADGTVTPSDLSTGKPVWDTSGNVGIGTSSPEQRLDVVGTQGRIRLDPVNTSGACVVNFTNAAASNFNPAVLASSELRINTVGTERMRIDGSGRVMLGSTTADGRLKVVENATGTGVTFYSSSDNAAGQIGTTNEAGTTNGLNIHAYRGDGKIVFTVNSSERARIDSSGNVMIGTTSSRNQRLQVVAPSGIGTPGLQVGNNGNGGIDWYNASGGYVASIIVNSSSVAYNTTSDYRLKENIAPMTGALDKVSALKPVTYTWKSTGEASQGFIAHELAEVCPDAVSGEKDAVNEDGSIKPQGIDTSFLVATLTAAIQEQQAIITELKTRIEALEQA